ncbi:TIGR03086 family metal-binding protein [Actinospica robiniae]|uniref:TIGR03086 family metal-binding protein n=1 Tax=Actinospica robiniae TaxID=304901 RepID=UPI0004204B90|nr:TIGR03086 family metal-binding protein [Actinospica robiniae]
MTNTGWTILDAAHTALRTVVAPLTEADLAKPTPCEQWTVAQVLQHAAGDQLAYVAAITGEGGPTDNPFAPSGTLDRSAAELAEAAISASAAAWATVPQSAETVPSPLPQGALAPQLAVGYCSLDAAVHAWDIAVATGQPSPLTPELAKRLMTAATELTEPLRGWGAYATAIAPENGDDEAAALLRYLGRRPEWTA